MTKKPQQPENQPQGDDRNIVPLDSSYEGGTLEDRLFLFWTDNRRLIVGVCVAAVVVLLGWGLLSVIQARRNASIAADYQQALTIEEKQAFAEEAAPHPLAGAAFLEVADHQFTEGNYQEAAASYLKAAENLGGLPTAGRARLGHGSSLALAGQDAEALAYFEQIAGDAENYGSVRAEAYYHAATLAIALGQPETARQHVESIGELEGSAMWANRGMSLLRSLPEEEGTEAEVNAETAPAAAEE